jgi:hypothetical protein
MHEIELVQIYDRVQKKQPLFPLDIHILQETDSVDSEILRQQCILYGYEPTKVLEWIKNEKKKILQEQLGTISAATLSSLQDIFERIVRLPVHSENITTLIDIIKELRDFYNQNYVNLGDQKFMDNLLDDLDRIFRDTILQVKEKVRDRYNKLRRP